MADSIAIPLSAADDAADRRRRIFAIVGSSSGNLVEWYDFYCYAFFALYFAPAFFPKGDATSQLLQTAGVFAVGFFMSQLDIAARRNELLLQELNFIHTPAFRIANVVGSVHQVPGIQWLKFDISCGIIIEWTLVGLLAGMIQNLWARHRSRGAAWPVKGSSLGSSLDLDP